MKGFFVVALATLILGLFWVGLAQATRTIATPAIDEIRPQQPDENQANWGVVELTTTTAVTDEFYSVMVELSYNPEEISILDFSDLRTLIQGWSFSELIGDKGKKDGQLTKISYYASSATAAASAVVTDQPLLYFKVNPLKIEEMRQESKLYIQANVRLDEAKYETICEVSLLLNYGDFTGDLNPSSLDAAILLQYLVGMENTWTGYIQNTRWARQMSDVSGDGLATEYDAALILQYEAGVIVTFPVEASGMPPGAPGLAKPRLVSLGQTRQIGSNVYALPVNIDRADGIIAGYFEFWHDPEFMRIKEIRPGLFEKSLSVFNPQGEISRAGFARAEELKGKGSLFEIIFEAERESQYYPLFLQKVRLNEDLIPAEVQKSPFTKEDWKRWLKQVLVAAPKESSLLQNYPNPFNPETWIPFKLREAGQPVIQIFNLQGQLVRQLKLGFRFPGSYLKKQEAAYWNGKNSQGEMMPSGIYFYTLKSNHFAATRRMVIVK